MNNDLNTWASQNGARPLEAEVARIERPTLHNVVVDVYKRQVRNMSIFS